VRSLVDSGYQSAYSILEQNQPIMHRLATALLERETIDANDIKMLIEGRELPPLNPPSNGSASGDPEVKVLKPEGGRASGFPEGSPSPA
jgi:cell division protease FtsH